MLVKCLFSLSVGPFFRKADYPPIQLKIGAKAVKPHPIRANASNAKAPGKPVFMRLPGLFSINLSLAELACLTRSLEAVLLMFPS